MFLSFNQLKSHLFALYLEHQKEIISYLESLYKGMLYSKFLGGGRKKVPCMNYLT